MKRIFLVFAVLLTFAIGTAAQAADNSTAGKRVSATFQPPAQATKVAAADKAKTVAAKSEKKAAGKSGAKKAKKSKKSAKG